MSTPTPHRINVDKRLGAWRAAVVDRAGKRIAGATHKDKAEAIRMARAQAQQRTRASAAR